MTPLSELARAVLAWQRDGAPDPAAALKNWDTSAGVWMMTCRSTLDHAIDVGVYACLADALPELVQEITAGLGEGPQQQVTAEAHDLDGWVEIRAGSAVVRLDHRAITRRPPADPERER